MIGASHKLSASISKPRKCLKLHYHLPPLYDNYLNSKQRKKLTWVLNIVSKSLVSCHLHNLPKPKFVITQNLSFSLIKLQVASILMLLGKKGSYIRKRNLETYLHPTHTMHYPCRYIYRHHVFKSVSKGNL